MELTDKQQAALDVLIETDFISPAYIGKVIKDTFGTGSGHSSTGSPICRQLQKYGLVERNHKGHYRKLSNPRRSDKTV